SHTGGERRLRPPSPSTPADAGLPIGRETQSIVPRRRPGSGRGGTGGAEPIPLRTRAQGATRREAAEAEPPRRLQTRGRRSTTVVNGGVELSGQLRARADAELRMDAREERLDRGDADEQLRGEFLVRRAVRHELGDALVARRGSGRSRLRRTG